MKRNALWLGIFFLLGEVGCVTLAERSKKKVFPSHFFAEQILTARNGGNELKLLVQLDKIGKKIRLLFLDPRSQQPVVGLGGVNSSLHSVHWFVEAPKELKEQAEFLYAEMSYIFDQHYNLGDVIKGRIFSQAKYQIGDTNISKICFFPNNIVIRYPQGRVISIETLEIDCRSGTE